MLEKVEKAVIQTDEDLSKKLDLLPKFRPKQLTFGAEKPKPLPATSEDDEEKSKNSIQLLITKGLGATSEELGPVARKYLPFQDKKFGIWFDGDGIYIDNKSSKVIIDGDDLIINNEPYKGTHGLWKLLTKPNKEELDKETLNTWWDKDNFTEKDLTSYKEILVKTHFIYQNNNPSSKSPKSSNGEK